MAYRCCYWPLRKLCGLVKIQTCSGGPSLPVGQSGGNIAAPGGVLVSEL